VSVCPDHERRAAMSDGEFWEHVLGQRAWSPDDDPEPDVDPQMYTEPCSECGATGACAWDSEGRPMIHTTLEERET
jgi:hypothetical protein